MATSDLILDVDLLAFERGSAPERRAVVDGVMRSLGTGFVLTRHDLPGDLLDEAYGMLTAFFALPAERKARWVAHGSHGQTGYTGVLVETAATSDVPDWKEMLNWGPELPEGHPLRRKYPTRYRDQVLPEDDVPGIRRVLFEMQARVTELQRRFLRIIAVGLGASEAFFDDLLVDGSHLTRAIRYPPMTEAPGEAGHVWAGAHGDINLITALPRATAPGLQVLTPEGWVDAVAPDGQVIMNSGIMLERLSNGRIPSGVHRVVAGDSQEGERLSVVSFCHPAPWMILSPLASAVDAEHPVRYGAIEAGDLLDRVLYEINMVEEGRRVPSS